MQTYLLYLYQTIDSSLLDDVDKGILKSKTSNLIAITNTGFSDNGERRKLVKDYNLLPFEIEQENFDMTILRSLNENIFIHSIKFESRPDCELEQELNSYVKTGDFENALILVNRIRAEMSDVKSLGFVYKNRLINVDKYGVVELEGEIDELSELAFESPVAYLTGIKEMV